MTKIKASELEKIITEEIEQILLEEGIFGQLGQAFKGAVSGAKAGFSHQRSADKEQDLVVKIAAEILSDPMRTGVAAPGTPDSPTPNLSSLLGATDKQAVSKTDIVREEESDLEEATSKEIAFFTKKIKQALASGQVTVDGLKSEIQKLSDNDVVKAIPGVMEMFPKEEPTASQQQASQNKDAESQFFGADEPEQPTRVIPSQANQTQVNQTIKMASDDGPTKIDGAPTAATSPAKQQIEDMVSKFEKGIFPNMKNVWIDQADQLIDKINNAGLSSEEAEKYKQIVNKKLEDVKAFPGQ